jgi:hypothetical protein
MIRSTEAKAGRNGQALDPALKAIGRALEDHYIDVVDAPLPGRFLELLAQLKVSEGHVRGAKEIPNVFERS